MASQISVGMLGPEAAAPGAYEKWRKMAVFAMSSVTNPLKVNLRIPNRLMRSGGAEYATPIDSRATVRSRSGGVAVWRIQMYKIQRSERERALHAAESERRPETSGT